MPNPHGRTTRGSKSNFLSVAGRTRARSWIEFIWVTPDLWVESLRNFAENDALWEPSNDLPMRLISAWCAEEFNSIYANNPHIRPISKTLSKLRRVIYATSEPAQDWSFTELAILARIGMLFHPSAYDKDRDERFKSFTLDWWMSVVALETDPIAEYRFLTSDLSEYPERHRLHKLISATKDGDRPLDPLRDRDVEKFLKRFDLEPNQSTLIFDVLRKSEPTPNQQDYLQLALELAAIYAVIDPSFDHQSRQAYISHAARIFADTQQATTLN